MFERFFGRALCESMNRMREKIGQIRCRVTPKYRHSMNVLHPKAAKPSHFLSIGIREQRFVTGTLEAFTVSTGLC
jgi:hypothetical protein